MPVISKLAFVPFTPPHCTNLQHNVYQSDRDTFWGKLRDGLNTLLPAPPPIERDGATLILTRPDYRHTGRTSTCTTQKRSTCRSSPGTLGVLLDGWPWHIPFTNLNDIKGGAEVRDLCRDGMLKFVHTPPDVHQRALHDPESVLPHVMSAAKLHPLPPTIQTLKFSQSRFRDLTAALPHHQAPPRTSPCTGRGARPPSGQPRARPHFTSSSRIRERCQCCDVNKACNRPISNLEAKPSRSRKVGALTSHFVLDARRPKPRVDIREPSHEAAVSLSEGEGEKKDMEDESDRRHQVKRRRCL
ncbi:hypothetical protein LXA43DRAFT_1149491 [Ganoderma leucocontextum]|nr:hypothetical protein LXA43DRAFT_1104632 [Ganoderma leucocontextum]KAI1782168.1 hypothetical protein LXA43DRAFT_1149491 [Ganoderma leucocontextum]